MRSRATHSRKDRTKAVSEAMSRLAMQSQDLQLASSRFAICVARHHGADSTAHQESASNYCRLVVCEPCQITRFAEEHNGLLGRIAMCFERGFKNQLLSVTVSSPLVTFLDAEVVVDRMLGAWTRLSDRKAFQSVAHGYARTVRLEVDVQANAVCCHTSVLMISERTHGFQTSEDWLTAWIRHPKCGSDHITYFKKIDPLKPDAWSEVDAEVVRITRIGLDPGELCEFVDTQPACDPTKLGHVLKALRGRKLIRSGRGLASA